MENNEMTFESRTAFNTALDNDPNLIKTIEGWDTLPSNSIISDGSTVNGITYDLTRGDARVTTGGIKISEPNNLGFPDEFLPTRDRLTLEFAVPVLAFGVSFNTFATQEGDYLATNELGSVFPSSFDPSSPGATTGAFVGFTSEEAFQSVTIDAVAFARYGLDDLTTAIAPIIGTNQKDELVGSPFNDSIHGGNGKDLLEGKAGDDVLGGGNGKDTLIGGPGNDELTGGRGKDCFVLAAGDGSDTITDFELGKDVISLSGGLTFGALSFSGSDVINAATSEVLATLVGIDAAALTTADVLCY